MNHDIVQNRVRSLEEQIESTFHQRGALIDAAAAESRGFTPAEQRQYDQLGTNRSQLERELTDAQANLATTTRQQQMGAAAAQSRAELNGKTTALLSSVNEPGIYTRHSEHSYFRDMFGQHTGNLEAADRLIRNQREVRAMSTSAGAGGEAAPPAWLIDEFVNIARPARVTADLCNFTDLPPGVSSVNLPKANVGTLTGVQATQNSALAQQDMTTGSLTSGVTTIGGKVIISQQLLDQSPVGGGFDELLMRDLAADYAAKLDQQVISGSGAAGQLLGILTVGSVPTTTYTDASPAVAGSGKFLSKLASAIQTVQTTRYLPPTAVVMHPRRWAWICAAVDTQNRPLVTPEANVNAPGTVVGGAPAQGAVGTLAGLPVYVDPNIPTNLGAGTNEDRVLVLRAPDLYLWESQLQLQTFTATYADSLGVLVRCYRYSAFIPNRYAASLNVISGTGLVAPTF